MNDKTKKYVFLIGGIIIGYCGYNYFGWKPDLVSKKYEIPQELVDTKK